LVASGINYRTEKQFDEEAFCQQTVEPRNAHLHKKQTFKRDETLFAALVASRRLHN
jgi:hypothetical protein